MSLLKLLFDLPETGGESNFTVEEQEELMAFEHNLDEHLEESFAIPTQTETEEEEEENQFGSDELFPGAQMEEDAVLRTEAIEGQPVDVPAANGVYSGHEEDMVNGVEADVSAVTDVGTVSEVKLDTDIVENGHAFGSSIVVAEQAPQGFSEDVAPVTQESASLEMDAAVKSILEPALDPLQVDTPAKTTEEPALDSVEEDTPAKKPDCSIKHQGSGKAVWIKWRGKCQGGIQVRVEDCRAATVKAMPTYGKKEYVPIYLSTRQYIWIDAQNIFQINENPEPLLSGTHDEWRKLVVDTGAPRRRTFLSLGWEMLDISDRLHILGVIERARFVSVWKEFAKEVTEASKYSELGSLLVRIHAVVEPLYVRQSWVEKRLNAWTEECMKAETAATIEKLTKELIRVILWDDAAKLWEAPMQPVLDPGWTDWKGPAFDEVTSTENDPPIPADKPSRPSSSSSLTPKADKEGNPAPRRGRKPKEGTDRSQPVSSDGRISTRKQVKIEKHCEAGPSSSAAMEQSPAASEVVAHCSQPLAFHMDATKSEFAVDHPLETAIVASELQLTDQGSGLKLSQDGPLNSASKTWKWKFKSDAWGCSAFLKSKKRRCPRQAWKGIYCEKHQGLAQVPPVADPDVEPSHLCMARYWVENRRCANSVVEGSYYCVVHADYRVPKPEDSGALSVTKDNLNGGNDKVVMGKHLRCTGVTVQGEQCTHMVRDGQSYCAKHAAKDADQGGNSFVTPVKDESTVVKIEQLDQQLIAGGRSTGRPSEKHLQRVVLNANGGFRNGGNFAGPIVDKNLSRLVTDLSLKDRRSFLKARDLLCKYMNAGLSKSKGEDEVVQCGEMMDFIVDEAARDFSSGEMLLKILSAEKERLAKMVLEDGTATRKSSNIIWHAVLSVAMDASGSQALVSLKPALNDRSADPQSITSSSQMEVGEAGMDARYLCCLCSRKFEQLSMLGSHWKEQHKREARLFEKCMICRVCGNSGEMFRNKLGVVRHWRAAHPTLPTSSPGWSVCVMCDKQCIDFDHLWQHVEDQHHSLWSSIDFAERVKATLMSREGHRCYFCGEVFSTYWEVQQHRDVSHKDQEQLHCGTKRNLDTMDSEVSGNDYKKVDGTSAEATYKYTCRYCGLKFRLLPDLGRHHQAEHKTQMAEGARGQSSASGKLAMQRRKLKQEDTGGEWHAVPISRGEGNEKEVNGKKWRFRARAKSKTVTRGRIVPMKKQSGGAEAILQRMRAVKQVLEDQKTKRPPRKRDRKAERARRLARLAVNGDAPVPIVNKYKCRFCGLQFALLPDLGRHHQAEHSAVKQAFIINSRGECQTGIFTLTKDGAIMPSHGDKFSRPPNSRELLEVARSACCKDWLFNELGRRYTDLPPRLFVQAAHLCSEAKVEIRWHQEKYVCPDGCKTYGASELVPNLDVDLSAYTKSSSKSSADDGADHAVAILDVASSSKKAILNCAVLCEDLSKGLEKVPIRCVVDENAMEPCTCSLCIESGYSTSAGDNQPWNNFVYITNRRLDPLLGLDTKSSQVGCSCTREKCTASTCEHVSMFDTDNAEACTMNGESIKGRFPYDDFGRIILDVGYMVYECNSSCHCKENCHNRVLQKGVHLKLEVFQSRHKGWGVRAAESIVRGTFVCEYVGEVLNDTKANRRGERYDQVGCSYLYNIDAHLDVTVARVGSKPFVIDATSYGNVARFINHSCEPNLINYEVLVESMDCQLAHIGFFAKRDIAMGEELAYDYRYRLLPGKGCPCHCGALNCRGRLY